MIKVKRELHPENQETVDFFDCVYVTDPTYASTIGTEMLELRLEADSSQMWRSENNGKSWSLAEEMPLEEKKSDGTYVRRNIGPFFLDPDHNLLIRFFKETIFRNSVSDLRSSRRENIFKEFMNALVLNSNRVFYQISHDTGKTWTARKQLIEKGSEYNEVHWAANVTYLQNGLIPTVPPYHKLPDGRIVFHNQGATSLDVKKYGSIQAGRFYARWNADLTDLEWQSGGTIIGGGCEQAVAILKGGRMLSILRSQGQIEPYYFDSWLRAFSISDDGGDSWTKPEPLMYTDGSCLTSPRAWSQLIRSEKNGRLYWIANILPAYEEMAELREKFPFRADPRYPIQIVEVDEDKIALKRETLTIIDDRLPEETHWVRFSNFYAYNDRETGEIVLLLKKHYCELVENLEELSCPAYRYRITVMAN